MTKCGISCRIKAKRYWKNGGRFVNPPEGGETYAYYVPCGAIYGYYHGTTYTTQKPPLCQVTVFRKKFETVYKANRLSQCLFVFIILKIGKPVKHNVAGRLLFFSAFLGRRDDDFLMCCLKLCYAFADEEYNLAICRTVFIVSYHM